MAAYSGPSTPIKASMGHAINSAEANVGDYEATRYTARNMDPSPGGGAPPGPLFRPYRSLILPPALCSVPLLAFLAISLAFALGYVARGSSAQLWDDALFFKRVAFNIVHHGFAGWNQADGPVFINTSQLYQLITTLLLVAAPNHFTVAAVLWSALSVCACFCILWYLARREDPAHERLSATFLFVVMQAPPIFLAMRTGMETCTVFVVIALFVLRLRGDPRGRYVAALAAMNLVTYLARPDAVLLTSVASLGVLAAPTPGRTRRLVTFSLYTAMGIGLLSAGFAAYYGTAIPLAAFLKIAPWSVYDSAYLALGRSDKIRNLVEIGLVLAPLLPVLAMRLDRLNLSLLAGALSFIIFHATTTNEIMGYHARYYAPALPLIAYAALRGVTQINSRGKALAVFGFASAAGVLALIAFHRSWIECSTRGFVLNRVPGIDYLVYFLGLPMVAALLLLPPNRRAALGSLLSAMAAAGVGVASWPGSPSVVPDLAGYEKTVANDRALVGIDIIRRCFPEPFQLAHSELGIPGVLFPESRVIDYTGLANPSIAHGRFSFETMCENDRPEFLFRPHWTHKRLNELLSASRCIASRYTSVNTATTSSCPLFVRNDLIGTFVTCAKPQP